MAFNQNISSWNTSKVTNMDDVMRYAKATNFDVTAWDFGSVTTMLGAFLGVDSFEAPLQPGEIFKPVSNFHLQVAVAACLDPTGNCAAWTGWSSDKHGAFCDVTNSINPRDAQQTETWATADGSNCPVQFGPMSEWDTSSITSMVYRELPRCLVLHGDIHSREEASTHSML